MYVCVCVSGVYPRARVCVCVCVRVCVMAGSIVTTGRLLLIAELILFFYIMENSHPCYPAAIVGLYLLFRYHLMKWYFY